MDNAMTSEDREFFTDIRAWYEEHNRKLRDEFRHEFMREFEAQRAEERRLLEAQRAEERRLLEAQRAEERRQAELNQLNQLVHLFEHRLRRQLTTDERALVASRMETLGSTHLADLVLDLSAPELAAWLKQSEMR